MVMSTTVSVISARHHNITPVLNILLSKLITTVKQDSKSVRIFN